MRVALAGFEEAIDLAASVNGVAIGIEVFARSGSSLLVVIDEVAEEYDLDLVDFSNLHPERL